MTRMGKTKTTGISLTSEDHEVIDRLRKRLKIWTVTGVIRAALEHLDGASEPKPTASEG